MSADREFSAQELIQAWLDGEATLEQQAQLREWLKRDSANVQIFVRESHTHRVLRDISLGQQMQASLPPQEVPETAVKVLPKQRSGVWFAVGLAACVLLTVAVCYQTQLAPRDNRTGTTDVSPSLPHTVVASVAEARADVRVQRGDKSFVAASGFNLEALDKVTVPENGSAVIKYPDGSTLSLKPQTELSLQPEKMPQISEDAGKLVKLLKGSIEVSAAKQPSENPMVFTTAQAVAVVLGTKFTLLVDDDSTRLDVTEGRVKFRRNDSTRCLIVPANGYALADSNTMFSANAIADNTGETERVLDDHENAFLQWSHYEETAPLDFGISTEQAHSGTHSLRVIYRPADTSKYTELFHPISIEKSDHALRFYIFVESCDAKSNWNVQLRLRDRSCWLLNDGMFSAFKPGWNQVEIDIQKPIKRAWGNTPYVSTEADGLLFSACTSSATFYLDDFTIVGNR